MVIGESGEDVTGLMTEDSLSEIYRIWINQNSQQEAESSEINPDDPSNLNGDGEILAPNTPTKTGYKFIGWQFRDGSLLTQIMVVRLA